MQRTLIIFKPDCVQRRLVGAILQRFEAKGLRIAALKLIQVDRALAEKHYAEHQGKPFFGGLIDFITGRRWSSACWRGTRRSRSSAACWARPTAPRPRRERSAATISISKQNNLVHGSDSAESAEREIAPLVPARGAGRLRDRRERVGLRRI